MWARSVLVAAVTIPKFKYGHHGSPLDLAVFSMLHMLDSIPGVSSQLAQEQSQCTCDPSAELLSRSLFMQNGQPFPFVIQCVPAATGAALASPPEWPGALLLAVSTDRKQAWFTATVLARRADRQATCLTREGEPPGHRARCAVEELGETERRFLFIQSEACHPVNALCSFSSGLMTDASR